MLCLANSHSVRIFGVNISSSDANLGWVLRHVQVVIYSRNMFRDSRYLPTHIGNTDCEISECLDSVQKILFPLTDRKSKSILLSLTSTSSFDPDCLRFDSASIRNNDEKDIAYHYFGERLAELYDELENPTPRGSLEKWLERRSGARYVMLATLIGVIFAVILGMAGLAVGGYVRLF